MNADYHEGLELLLDRLASINASIWGISVESAPARALASPDRELDLPFPIELSSATDAHDLRLQITRAQRPVARRDDAKPGGGNDQKTIRLSISCSDQGTNIDQVRRLLVDGIRDSDVSPTSADH